MHLIHPALVHFSIASIVIGGCCEAFGLLARRDGLYRWGSPLLLFGLASLVPTLATGYLAANSQVIEGPAVELLDAHERNGWILLFLLFGSQFWKAACRGRPGGGHRIPYALAVIVLIGLTVYSGWLGGRMVYTAGVGVG